MLRRIDVWNAVVVAFEVQASRCDRAVDEFERCHRTTRPRRAGGAWPHDALHLVFVLRRHAVPAHRRADRLGPGGNRQRFRPCGPGREQRESAGAEEGHSLRQEEPPVQQAVVGDDLRLEGRICRFITHGTSPLSTCSTVPYAAPSERVDMGLGANRNPLPLGELLPVGRPTVARPLPEAPTPSNGAEGPSPAVWSLPSSRHPVPRYGYPTALEAPRTLLEWLTIRHADPRAPQCKTRPECACPTAACNPTGCTQPADTNTPPAALAAKVWTSQFRHLPAGSGRNGLRRLLTGVMTCAYR